MNLIRLPILGAFIFAASLCAQSSESIPFRLNMSPANEVPAITNLNATGFGTVWVHVIRDAAGRIQSGTVDFGVTYQFPGAVTFTGLHIHRGNAGTNGPVLIDTRITAANNVVSESGSGRIDRTAEIAAGTPNVAVLDEMITNPAGFYLNLHTTAHPGGAVRGQMVRAERRVFGSVLSPANEVPAVTTSQASGLAFVTVLASFEGGVLTSAEATFDVNYTGFADGTQFTGMHIHSGRQGVNGPVTIDTGLSRAQNIFAGTNGAGNLKYIVNVNVNNAPSVNTVLDIWGDASRAYLNLHTVANPGGEIRAQLRSTEVITFRQRMLPSNEVPPVTGLDATTDAAFALNLLRNPDGTAQGAYAEFNANYRFPGAVTFTGFHIHQGDAGANGPVTIDSGIRAGSTIVSESGAGNIYRTAIAGSETQVAALNNILTNPANNYLNLHTAANPGGAVRAQLASPNTTAPSVQTMINSVSDPSLTTMGQGALVSIYGTNLTRLSGNLDGWQGVSAPTTLNGTSATIGGLPMPLVLVSPNVVLGQVPFEVAPADNVELTVRTPSGTSPAFRIPVRQFAPGIFFDRINDDGAIAVAYNMATSQQITREAPAAPGTLLGVYGTGFGQTEPAITTGTVASAVAPTVNMATIRLGADTMLQARPRLMQGFLGLYELFFTVPAGLSGPTQLEVTYGGARANRTVIYLR